MWEEDRGKEQDEGGEREKKNKKLFAHEQYLHIFASTDVGFFFFFFLGLKYAKLSTFCILQTFATTDAVALIF